MKKSQAGAFTYLEVLIVLALVAVLTVIAIPNFLEAQTRSLVARSRAEMALLKSSVEAYRIETRAWPPNSQPGVPNGYDLFRLTTPVPYIARLPFDAFTGSTARQLQSEKRPPAAPYLYLNGMQVSPDGLRAYEVFGVPYYADEPQGGVKESQRLHSGLIAGMIWGYGPSDSLDAKPSPQHVQIVNGNIVRVTAYDPSNGTASRGDLVQILP